MPIEVRELVIRARVEDTVPASQNGSRPGHCRSNLTDRELEAIIAQCVDKVMDIMRKQKER